MADSITVTAHHAYEAQREDELSFAAGETIQVTDRSDADWWVGKKEDGSSGFFPSNFVNVANEGNETEKPVSKAEQQVAEEEQQKATTPADSDEPSAEVEGEGEGEKDTAPRQPIGMARVMEDYAMQNPGELTLHNGGIITIFEKLEDGWSYGELNGKIGRFPNKYVEDIDMPGRPDIGAPTVGVGKKEVGEEADAGKPGFKLAAFGVKQGGIGSLLAGGIPTLKKTVKKEDAPAEVSTPPAVQSPATEEKAAPSTESKTTKPILGKAIALHPYDAENSDELNLIRGEYIDILDRNADEGWWEGVNEKGETGIFPANFVKEIEQEPAAPVLPQRSRKSVASVGSVKSIESSVSRPSLPVREPSLEVTTPKEPVVAEEQTTEEEETPAIKPIDVQTSPVSPTVADPKPVSPEESDPVSLTTPVSPIKQQQDVKPEETSETGAESVSKVKETIEEKEEPAQKEVEDGAEDILEETAVSEKQEEPEAVKESISEKEDIIEAGTEENVEKNVEAEKVEEKKDVFGMQPTGPKLSTPSRAKLGKPRRSPQLNQSEPSQIELLQQEIDQSPQEESKQSEVKDEPKADPVVPPKPVKPIFAKFPTPFAAGIEELSSKQLKPVQRRMWEPAPAHEPKETKEEKPATSDEPPRPTGVKNIASRFNFAGVPSGGGNDVLELKLKNFTKNEVDKVRQELEQELEKERAQRQQLEQQVETLSRIVTELQSRLG
ncbi:SH3-domain kinase binding protein 1 [Apophysomyces ossiformis]|uniref:SH3-domain kinase binding protein 1 n=1 Tax=Apophysomyces ossiformis TaxID=679940 RepID=A0A8H7BYZ6_9FUNG|nr:SH3-domain kinase binding protein 1 [Apophysomyces ossiformis]